MDDIRYIVNVEAVVYKGDQYLITKRSEKEEYAPGIFANPGGKVEVTTPQKEVLENTIIREIKEEVDLELKRPFQYINSKSFFLDGKELIIDIIFLCEYKSGTAICKDQEEIEEVNWLTLNEIKEHPDIEYWLKETIEMADKKRRQI